MSPRVSPPFEGLSRMESQESQAYDDGGERTGTEERDGGGGKSTRSRYPTETGDKSAFGASFLPHPICTAQYQS